MRRASAFTLFELLVVITIFAVLTSMLLPAVKLVRDSARTVACASNLRQCLVAITTYASHNRGTLPPSMVDRPNIYYVTDRPNWADRNFVGQFLNTEHTGKAIDHSFGYQGAINVGKGYVLRCPADPRPNQPGGIAYGWTMSYGANQSYMPIFWNQPPLWNQPPWKTAHLASFTRPDARGLLADCTGAQWQIWGSPVYNAFNLETDLMIRPAFSSRPVTWVDRHQGVNVGFMSGRVQKYSDPIRAAERPLAEILLVAKDPGNSLAWE